MTKLTEWLTDWHDVCIKGEKKTAAKKGNKDENINARYVLHTHTQTHRHTDTHTKEQHMHHSCLPVCVVVSWVCLSVCVYLSVRV